MRLLPVGMLLLLPVLLAASPAPPGWQPVSDAGPSLPPPPPLRADQPALRTTDVPASAPSPAPPLNGSLAEPVPQADYGPRKMTFPGGIKAAFDMVYQTWKGYRPMTLDAYVPPPREVPFPLIVYVHGGGWNGGGSRQSASIGDLPAALAALAAKGYVVASINYRLSGEARFPAALVDVKAAIRYMRGHAHDLNLDVTRAAVWGEGSGGQLAALAGLSCGVALFQPEGLPGDAPSDCVQAVVDWGGATDLKAGPGKGDGFTPTPVSDAGEFLGCEPATCPPGLARIASPLSYISATSPAFLIQHGAADTKVPLDQSQRLAAALKAANVPAELVAYPGVGQGFGHDGVPDPAVTRQALDKMADFLAAQFPAQPMDRMTAQSRGPVY